MDRRLVLFGEWGVVGQAVGRELRVPGFEALQIRSLSASQS